MTHDSKTVISVVTDRLHAQAWLSILVACQGVDLLKQLSRCCKCLLKKKKLVSRWQLEPSLTEHECSICRAWGTLKQNNSGIVHQLMA